jgi:hypothetical protein
MTRLACLVMSVACALTAAGCDVNVSRYRDLAPEFARVETGIDTGSSRADVLQLMGSPARTESRDLFGFSCEELRFLDRKQDYSVLIVLGRAMSKSSTPRREQ